MRKESPETARQSSPLEATDILDAWTGSFLATNEWVIPSPGLLFPAPRVWPLTRLSGLYALAPPRPVEGPDW